MNFNDSQAEETLDTFFHCNAPPAGGDTAQLRSACSLLQQLISQDLWCAETAPRSVANSSTDLWSCSICACLRQNRFIASSNSR